MSRQHRSIPFVPGTYNGGGPPALFGRTASVATGACARLCIVIPAARDF